ncbi:MAG: hypothetical protein ACQEWU_07480 [Bacillota bacterium]|uniref:Uncharacterized protein n=1 Tax=Virgibacillus salarius TaxID=447199 RepID=A0A941ICG1_9BACI|nr:MULTISPECIES: hypothetical protein [Bacillaceae]NAZ10172.1 hypothetical protein [Agaribacter marinus]MBR7797461.1 hypothetical protein [Virgibacillus salarius]MCC2249719.1 hypothetical protein [Virgibacillus sp. AGTR]MDY7042710.1 hypothetical protein [Virgibacillus sp. M23]WBX79401.1 hypothetical protein PD280_17010 [Virgibacillus salarius]
MKLHIIASVIAVLIIIFILTQKNIKKKLDLTVIVIAAMLIFIVENQWIWISVFVLTLVYFGIKYAKSTGDS